MLRSLKSRRRGEFAQEEPAAARGDNACLTGDTGLIWDQKADSSQ